MNDKRSIETNDGRFLVVDGAEYPASDYDEGEGPVYAGDGQHAPFVVFDVNAQRNIAGPFDNIGEAVRVMNIIVLCGVGERAVA